MYFSVSDIGNAESVEDKEVNEKLSGKSTNKTKWWVDSITLEALLSVIS